MEPRGIGHRGMSARSVYSYNLKKNSKKFQKISFRGKLKILTHLIFLIFFDFFFLIKGTQSFLASSVGLGDLISLWSAAQQRRKQADAKDPGQVKKKKRTKKNSSFDTMIRSINRTLILSFHIGKIFCLLFCDSCQLLLRLLLLHLWMLSVQS